MIFFKLYISQLPLFIRNIWIQYIILIQLIFQLIFKYFNFVHEFFGLRFFGDFFIIFSNYHEGITGVEGLIYYLIFKLNFRLTFLRAVFTNMTSIALLPIIDVFFRRWHLVFFN